MGIDKKDLKTSDDGNKPLEDDDFMNYYEDKQTDESSKKQKKVDKQPERTLTYEILTFIRDLAIILLIFWVITTFIGEKTNVIGDSMEPHIHDGDFFILNKLTYRFSDPKRFDIIVFPYNNGEANYIKRVIGLPGEEINFTPEGKILINGNVLDENYGIEPIRVLGNQTFPLVVPEGEYFVMGDNRNDSSDSRYQDVGTIPKDKMLGKTLIRIWPLNKIGVVK